MIAIVDYGAGNLRSVTNTFRHLGADVFVTDQPQDLAKAEKVVLPGVGAFGAGMDALRQTGFIEPIKDYAATGKALIGICLGMQYLFDESEEMGLHQGLGLLPGRVVKFDESQIPRIPHIGWNQLHIEQAHPVFNDIATGNYAYFVHSYYAEPAQQELVLASTDYGDLRYASVVGKDNVIGIQCHPEKSQTLGLHFLKNFVEWQL